MKKQILNLGRALNKAEQKQIKGGGGGAELCLSNTDCHWTEGCCLNQNSCRYGECMSPSIFEQECNEQHVCN